MYVEFELTIGDFIDRMTIAELKWTRIGSENTRKEYTGRFLPAYQKLISNSGKDKEINTTYQNLIEVNRKLWDVEDMIRNESEPEFVKQLSLDIISLNDRRAYYKRQIDQFFGLFGDQKKYVGHSVNYTV